MEATKPETMDETVKGLGDDLKKKMVVNKTVDVDKTNKMRGGFIRVVTVADTTEYVVEEDTTVYDFDFEAEGFTLDDDDDDCISVDPVEEERKHEEEDDDIVYSPSRALSPMPYEDDCCC